MACESPISLKNPRYKKMRPSEVVAYSRENFARDTPPDLYLSVPCGCCQYCEKRRMRDYQIRLLYEVAKYPNSLFITLTFNDLHLRRFSSDPNSAVRLFLDRVRKRYGKSVRHWIVAEYGTLHGRIHYHGILFNTPSELNVALLTSLWSYGFCYLGYANEKTARYICKYVTKSSSPGKRPPRVISSKGIGSDYLSPSNIRFHNDGETMRPFLYYGSYKVPLPRYYYDKIFSDADKVKMILDRENLVLPMYLSGQKYWNLLDYCLARDALHKRNVRLKLSATPKVANKMSNKTIVENGEFAIT